MATATTPRTKPEDVVARADGDGVEFIRLWFTDINGQLKSFSVGREELEHALADGMGFDGFNLGPELAFFYFASDGLGEDDVPTILDKGGYFDLTTLDAASDLRRDTVNALKAVGIPVEYTHHEVGPSQHEIDM